MDRWKMAGRRNYWGTYRDRMRIGSGDIHAHSRRFKVEFCTRPNEQIQRNETAAVASAGKIKEQR